MPDYIVDGHDISAADEDAARAEVRRLYGHEAESVTPARDEDPVDLAGYVTEMETYPDNHAFHRDGQPCVRATALRDCPENHRYGRTFEEAH